MARRKRYPRLPNGYGSIKRLSGKNRTNPYGVYPPTREFDRNGIPVPVKALCYVDDWYKGFTVLTWYKNGEYWEGREKELSGGRDELKEQIIGILSKYNQNKREIAEKQTFREVFEAYYLWKFKKEYGHKEKKTSMENCMRSAYKNSSVLHDLPFRNLTAEDLQKVVDDCPLKHSSKELIVTLYHQMYRYAEQNDLIEKDYSKFVVINEEDDDEHGEPFSEEELRILWDNKTDETVEMMLIMCYSGFRIAEYKNLTVDLNGRYFTGGLKTTAGKGRIVPVHSCIYGIVSARIKRCGKLLPMSTAKYRLDMYGTLERLGIKRHTPHDCRHTFSALCEKYKVAENDRKRMLGHAFKDITNKVYGHRTVEDLRVEIEKIKMPF